MEQNINMKKHIEENRFILLDIFTRRFHYLDKSIYQIIYAHFCEYPLNKIETIYFLERGNYKLPYNKDLLIDVLKTINIDDYNQFQLFVLLMPTIDIINSYYICQCLLRRIISSKNFEKMSILLEYTQSSLPEDDILYNLSIWHQLFINEYKEISDLVNARNLLWEVGEIEEKVYS